MIIIAGLSREKHGDRSVGAILSSMEEEPVQVLRELANHPLLLDGCFRHDVDCLPLTSW